MKHGGSSHSKQKEKYGKLLKVQDLSLWQTGGLSLNMPRKIQAIKQRSFQHGILCISMWGVPVYAAFNLQDFLRCINRRIRLRPLKKRIDAAFLKTFASPIFKVLHQKSLHFRIPFTVSAWHRVGFLCLFPKPALLTQVSS